MTVKAGKSGQKLELETNHKVMNIVKSNPIANFTIDGGWNVQADLLPNLSIVSYSKFWQEFDKVANI